MKVVITGGAGFLGGRLARELAAKGTLTGPDGKPQKLTEIVQFDIAKAAPIPGNGAACRGEVGSIADMAEIRRVLAGASSVFHLGAVVSGGAEADFDLGMAVNLDGTRNVLEACRALGARPRVVFASSVAVFGGKIPQVVTDDTPVTPETSYGAQKAMGELMISDFSRKGFLDG
ncbi:MAG: NAD-dependent epimerase/dehydratase family protein, partial [Alphaproteobacteria bacterium]|nr:NAD-dependent epimerase/dehydratase family protein [Alphaproteobacteria bacterium]